MHYDRAFIFSQGQKKKKRAREAFPTGASITGVALAAALVAAGVKRHSEEEVAEEAEKVNI